MKAIILIVILAALFCPKDGKGHGKGKKVQRKQQSRPWYDISYDDMVMFDLIDDDLVPVNIGMFHKFVFFFP